MLSSVIRTFYKKVSFVLDWFGTGVTPGHFTFCCDGRFDGQHVALLDILRSDGAVMTEDGTKLRAATFAKLGGLADRFVECVAMGPNGNGSGEAGCLRLGTRWITQDGRDICLLDMIEAEGLILTPEGRVKPELDGPAEPYAWRLSDTLPAPEDYTLARSGFTLEEIYAAGEWEGAGSRLTADGASNLA